ncbi:hypothetical protein HELRODRAFT_168361 [Helobdella robusta]|uniref:Uncharacterized protein n=1 Tax=Helobdella robusta TaxID=6412 RepID=T1F0H0_HELRO|nr:hypothetical protein HELRODRAFT_168361 [Helobdella robusta]ESO09380.1 hypothetical protein HELRODRAFT_168361 [Helobdella robusta]
MFNMPSNKYSQKAGPLYGLSVMFNVEQENYIGEISQSAGLRVVVHDPKRMPFPEDEGILVPPNALTHIGVTMIKTKKMNGVYGSCYEASDDNPIRTYYQRVFNYSYCEKGCYYTCLSKEIVKQCKCNDITLNVFHEFDMIKPCSVKSLQDIRCVNKVWQMYVNGSLACDPACPMKRFKKSFLNNTQNYGKLEVYLRDFSYKVVAESPNYEFQQFISDIGGILGLYIGFSLLTIVEYLEFLLDLLKIICLSCVRYFHKKNYNSIKE